MVSEQQAAQSDKRADASFLKHIPIFIHPTNGYSAVGELQLSSKWHLDCQPCGNNDFFWEIGLTLFKLNEEEVCRTMHGCVKEGTCGQRSYLTCIWKKSLIRIQDSPVRLAGQEAPEICLSPPPQIFDYKIMEPSLSFT